MPLTPKGKKIMSAMKKQYGAEKGKQIFYASQNKGTISGTHKGKKRNLPGMSVHPVVDCTETKRRQTSEAYTKC